MKAIIVFEKTDFFIPCHLPDNSHFAGGDDTVEVAPDGALIVASPCGQTFFAPSDFVGVAGGYKVTGFTASYDGAYNAVCAIREIDWPKHDLVKIESSLGSFDLERDYIAAREVLLPIRDLMESDSLHDSLFIRTVRASEYLHYNREYRFHTVRASEYLRYHREHGFHDEDVANLAHDHRVYRFHDEDVANLANKLPTGITDPRALEKFLLELQEFEEFRGRGIFDKVGALLEAADCYYYAVKAVMNFVLRPLEANAFMERVWGDMPCVRGFSRELVREACIAKYTLRARPGNPKDDDQERIAVGALLGLSVDEVLTLEMAE